MHTRFTRGRITSSTGDPRRLRDFVASVTAKAQVVEQADTLGLNPSDFGRTGSSPVLGTFSGPPTGGSKSVLSAANVLSTVMGPNSAAALNAEQRRNYKNFTKSLLILRITEFTIGLP